MFKKMVKSIKEWWVWLFSKKVGQAINDESTTYEEVEAIVMEELTK